MSPANQWRLVLAAGVVAVLALEARDAARSVLRRAGRGLALGAALVGLGCARPTPPPPAPPPPIVVEIRRPTLAPACLRGSYKVLAAYECPESMGSERTFTLLARELGSDYDFCAIAECAELACLHAAGVRCEEPDAG